MEVAVFYDPEEALCAQSALQADGCVHFLHNSNHLSVAPSLRVALGGYRLLVMDEDVASVREVLAQLRSGRGAPIQAPDTFDPLLKSHKNWAWLPVALFLGVPFLPAYGTTGRLVFQFLIAIPFYLIIAIAVLY